MLQVLVNNEVLDFQIENEKTIGEVLGEVEQFCNENGHAVFKIIVDDEELLPEKLDGIFAMSPKTEMTIHLFTKSAIQIREDIAKYGVAFLDFSSRLGEVSVKMQTGDDSFVLNILAEISNALKDVFYFFSLESVSGIGISTIISDVSLLDTQKQIGTLLKDITTAFEEKDIVGVSDISEYELAPLLETFGNALKSVAA